MKKSLLTLLLLFLGLGYMMAQRTINGKISDRDGTPLIGATVLITGTSSGTITDENGNFQLTVPNEATSLTISYTGFTAQSVVLTSEGYYNLVLEEDITTLNEVVVTALGTERNAREVVYANQTVRAEDLQSTPNKNALQALRGKATGLKITGASGSVGASNRIVLRGEGSLTGDNNALIVIDGIPVDNSASRGGSGSAQDGYSDYGNRFNDLNPDDIESVTILKGPSATSLYGSRGASGVILVTTKTGGGGRDGNIEVGLNSSYSMERVYLLLKRQDRFGQGYDNAHFDTGENWSWGPAVDGVVRPWTSPVDADGDGAVEALTRPYSAVPDQIENFFNTGQTVNNSIYLSGAKGGFTYYASYSNLNQKGILDNTKYLRNTLNFRASSQLTSKLSTEFGFNYSNINMNTAQEGYRPFEGQNAYANAIQAPINIPYNELRDYNSPFHGFEGYYGSYSSNPYMILNTYINDGRINNFLGNLSLRYNLFKNFNLLGRIGMNYVNSLIETAVPVYQYADHLIWADHLELVSRGGRHNSIGEYRRSNGNATNIDGSLLGEYSTPLNDRLTLGITAGTNIFDRRQYTVGGETVGGLVVPGWYNLDNSVQRSRGFQTTSKYRLVGLLGNVKLGLDNKLFLEYSARNDWSSTLPKENNSFFYQAVGASAILSDYLNFDNSDALSFLKLRASVGTTGKDAGLYLLNSTFVGNPVIQSLNNHDLITPINGQPGFTLGNLIGNPELKPELTTTYEAGIDIGFLRNMINLEYTFYHSRHSDQIIRVSLPSTTGFTNTFGNIGEMTNTGHELALILKPLANVRNVTWDLNLNFATNKNKVVKVSDQQDELVVGGPYTNGAISVVAKEGLPFGTFRAATMERSPNGQVVVDAQGIPVLTLDEEYLGSYQPDYIAGIGSNVGFFGFNFNFLVDFRVGGKFLSITKNQTEFNGTALSTIINNRDSFVYENSVVKNADGSYSPNTTKINAQQLYAVSDIYQGGESVILDASFAKLREIGLSYDLGRLIGPNGRKWVKRASLGVYATNLKFWLPAENTYADPEINGPDLVGNATGIETTQTPPSRSYGIRLGLTF